MKTAGIILTSTAAAAMTFAPVAASAQTVRAQVAQWCSETASRTDAPGQTWHQTYCTGRNTAVDDGMEHNWLPIAALLGAVAIIGAIVLLSDDDDDDDDLIPVSP